MFLKTSQAINPPLLLIKFVQINIIPDKSKKKNRTIIKKILSITQINIVQTNLGKNNILIIVGKTTKKMIKIILIIYIIQIMEKIIQIKLIYTFLKQKIIMQIKIRLIV